VSENKCNILLYKEQYLNRRNICEQRLNIIMRKGELRKEEYICEEVVSIFGEGNAKGHHRLKKSYTLNNKL
jgi:hypothetical protein